MAQSVQYRVIGMDCASCASKIEKAVRSAGVASPRISTASQILTLDVMPGDKRLAAVELAVSEAGYHLDRLRQGQEGNRRRPSLI